MYNALDDMVASGKYTVVEEFALPAREARYKEIPRYLFDSRVGLAIHATVGGGGGMWCHQSIALEKIGDGANVVVSTGTASGKSLIFRSAAFHKALLNPKAKVLVFYPLKALSADQEVAWRGAARELELPETFIGRIDGTVRMAKREEVLESARVLLMTPDVCHAWVMSNLAKPAIKEFLRSLSVVVLDEAHTLEGVFGSNFAFLFRRLLGARNSLLPAAARTQPLSVIAATATIANPAEHMEKLTGLPFETVSEEDDGSPHFESRCVHVASPPGDEMSIARAIQIELLQNSAQGGFITFVDSRKGVEMLAVSANRELESVLPGAEVLPYRAGIDSADRKRIEKQLKKGTLRGVVSTSALELGIDLPHLQVGMNIGVPSTRKAYRQRLGRVGRSSRGGFLIIGDPNSFTRFGTTFREYHDMSVEPSYLYLDNRFMQYAHARCLADELEGCGAKEKTELPTRVDWPDGFSDVFKSALPGGDRPREFDAIAQLGSDMPQRNYPLRNVGEINFKISLGEHADPIGDANLPQALRECYPGATYLHMARPYKVQSWRTNAFQPCIVVRAVQGAAMTKPRIRTWINAGLTRADLVANHLRKAPNGFIAECQMQITEKVEGFQEGDVYKSYEELRAHNPHMRPRMRHFRTTGVVVCLDDPWIRESGHKQFIADHLRELFCREYSVGPQDIGTASTNIAVTTEEGHKPRSDCIALFDQTYGSLRLTERAYLDFSHLIDRLAVAAKSAQGEERALYDEVVAYLRSLDAGLEEPVEIGGSVILDGVGEGGFLQVFAKGSRVGYREQGVLFTDVEVLTPAILPPENKMFYQVKCPPKAPGAASAKRWVSAEFMEPTAEEGEWAYALWDPETQEYVEEPA